MSWTKGSDPVLGDRASVEAVETVIVPRSVDLDGMTVNRVLPALQRQMVGPFIFLDHFGPAEFLTDQAIDVRPHPHINLATATYLLSGEIMHRDSLGTVQTITPGAVSWMRAGKGIVHSERTPDAQRRTGHTLFGLQTWLALPEADEEGDPGFIHHDAGELPAVEDGPLSLRLVAGGMNGLRSPLKTASETLFADIVLKAGGRFGVEADTVERALYVLSGEVRVGGVAHGDQRLLILRPGDPVTLAAETDARVILLGGAPMEGPRYIWWNFVSSRPERIEQAKEEWAKGRFDTVPGDEEEFIPLPENIGKPRRATGGREFG